MKNIFKHHGIFFLFFLVGIFFRFYNLNWGAPFYFHPDERQNIAYPILASKSLLMLDQQNFDTGTFPLIIIKIIFSFLTSLFHNVLLLDQLQVVILLSRIISAAISVTILFLLFFVVKKIFGAEKAYITAAFATFSVGFIQFSHFGTIELWEALFFLLLFYYAWRIAKYAHFIDCILCGVLLGFAISTKILSVILIPAIFISFLLFLYRQHLSKNNLLKNIKKTLLGFFFFVLFSFFAFVITSLPLVKNFPAAYNSIHFESGVSLGKIPVFYTQGFYNTLPVLFQFTKVYPFLLNPLITLLFIPSIVFVIYFGIKHKRYSYLLLAACYLLLFLTQSFFFAKWTRYMVPTLPFIYIIIGVAIDDWLHSIKKKFGTRETFSYALITFPIVISFVFAAAFFATVYIQPSTPVQASNSVKNMLPRNANIITEPFDLGITPFNQYSSNIIFFNFYDMEDLHNPASNSDQLVSLLTTSDYIILPSQRIVKTRLTNSKKFPEGYKFYSQLSNGQLGFESIYETPCDIFCRIIYLDDPVFSFEETVNVFDRPSVFIFKKARPFNASVYQAMLR